MNFQKVWFNTVHVMQDYTIQVWGWTNPINSPNEYCPCLFNLWWWSPILPRIWNSNSCWLFEQLIYTRSLSRTFLVRIAYIPMLYVYTSSPMYRQNTINTWTLRLPCVYISFRSILSPFEFSWHFSLKKMDPSETLFKKR